MSVGIESALEIPTLNPVRVTLNPVKHKTLNSELALLQSPSTDLLTEVHTLKGLGASFPRESD